MESNGEHGNASVIMLVSQVPRGSVTSFDDNEVIVQEEYDQCQSLCPLHRKIIL